jgi:hypothetical protein
MTPSNPRGVLLRGRIAALDQPGPYQELGLRLQGGALARFSGVFGTRPNRPDVLCCALHCGAGPRSAVCDPSESDQDLLFASCRHALTLALSPLSTNASDYLRNDYFGIWPFEAAPFGRIKLRLTSLSCSGQGPSRDAKLLSLLAGSPVQLQLEVRAHQFGAEYRPIAVVELFEQVDEGRHPWHFDVFRCGRGIHPVGVIPRLSRSLLITGRRGRAGAARLRCVLRGKLREGR